MKTVIEMAREAGAIHIHERPKEFAVVGNEAIERFAELVRADERDRAMRENAYVAAEREACAKVLDEMADQMVADMEPSIAIAWIRNRAAAIRARGQA
jgi:hypothetical protein